MSDTVLIRVGSHRARHKMEQAIGRQPSLYSWRRRGEFYRLSQENAEHALAITGITKAREGDDLLQSWGRDDV